MMSNVSSHAAAYLNADISAHVATNESCLLLMESTLAILSPRLQASL